MIIYITTNLLDGKKYIGKDEDNNPKYLGSGLHLIRAIKKYGKKNFQKEILAYANNKEELNELEIYYIDYYNAQKSDLFYNIAPGGTGGITYKDKHPMERMVYQYTLDGEFIKEFKHAREANKDTGVDYKKISACCNNKRKQSHGFMWSFIKSDKLPQYRRNKSKKVYQYDLEGNFIKEWYNVKEAGKNFSIKCGSQNIGDCALGKTKSAYGYKWRYN